MISYVIRKMADIVMQMPHIISHVTPTNPQPKNKLKDECRYSKNYS